MRNAPSWNKLSKKFHTDLTLQHLFAISVRASDRFVIPQRNAYRDICYHLDHGTQKLPGENNQVVTLCLAPTSTVYVCSSAFLLRVALLSVSRVENASPDTKIRRWPLRNTSESSPRSRIESGFATAGQNVQYNTKSKIVLAMQEMCKILFSTLVEFNQYFLVHSKLFGYFACAYTSYLLLMSVHMENANDLYLYWRLSFTYRVQTCLPFVLVGLSNLSLRLWSKHHHLDTKFCQSKTMKARRQRRKLFKWVDSRLARLLRMCISVYNAGVLDYARCNFFNVNIRKKWRWEANNAFQYLRRASMHILRLIRLFLYIIFSFLLFTLSSFVL